MLTVRDSIRTIFNNSVIHSGCRCRIACMHARRSLSHSGILRVSTSRNKTHYQQTAESRTPLRVTLQPHSNFINYRSFHSDQIRSCDFHKVFSSLFFFFSFFWEGVFFSFFFASGIIAYESASRKICHILPYIYILYLYVISIIISRIKRKKKKKKKKKNLLHISAIAQKFQRNIWDFLKVRTSSK